MCVVERGVERKQTSETEKAKKADDDRMISLRRKCVDVVLPEPAHLDHLCKHLRSSESLTTTLTRSTLS